MQEEFNLLLADIPRFGFSVCDIVEHENSEDEPIVCYPEISSKEPLLVGNVSVILNYAVHNVFFNLSNSLENPTWQDLLNEINTTIKTENFGYADLHTFDIVGITDNGMGYEIEAILI